MPETLTELREQAEQQAVEAISAVEAQRAMHPILAERLRRVMLSIGGVTKDGNYSQGSVHYNFRGIEQIAPRVRDAMIEHGVVCLPVHADMGITPREKGGLSEVTITYRFLNCDDREDFIDAQMVASAIDNGDKYVTKALTSAFKYLMLQTFCVGDPSDDQDAYSGSEDDETRAPEETAPLTEWRATDEEVEALRVATSMMSEQSKVAFASWWKEARGGSIREGRVNGRIVPSALALVQVLLDGEAQAEPLAEQEG